MNESSEVSVWNAENIELIAVKVALIITTAAAIYKIVKEASKD